MKREREELEKQLANIEDFEIFECRECASMWVDYLREKCPCENCGCKDVSQLEDEDKVRAARKFGELE